MIRDRLRKLDLAAFMEAGDLAHDGVDTGIFCEAENGSLVVTIWECSCVEASDAIAIKPFRVSLDREAASKFAESLWNTAQDVPSND